MKKLLIHLLVLAIVLSGCSSSKDEKKNEEPITADIQFSDIEDPELTAYIEDELYLNLIEELDSDEYFIENVEAVYVSKEYLEEMKYNSQSNLYFGYSLNDINEVFGETKYVFDMDDDGNTVVTELVEIEDKFNQILDNIIIGGGVILICVTVSLVAAPAGAPAISAIFAASAKSATTLAVSGAAMDGLISGVVTGYQTNDLDLALESGLVSASEGFKWGAIFGAVSGGALETFKLKGATANGLTMNEVAKIQKESKYPPDVIKSMHSYDEYEVYKVSNLRSQKINGKNALVQPIDLDYKGDGLLANSELIEKGSSPLYESESQYVLHHIGQSKDSPLAILTQEQHRVNHGILHKNTGQVASEIDRCVFASERKEFWQSYYQILIAE